MQEETQRLQLQQLSCLVLSILGLAGSIYVTISHFDSHIALVCGAGAGAG